MASLMCALQQKSKGQNVKTVQTVDMPRKTEYNYYENSLRIVCPLRGAAYSVRGIFVYVSARQGGKGFPFLNQYYFMRGVKKQ